MVKLDPVNIFFRKISPQFQLHISVMREFSEESVIGWVLLCLDIFKYRFWCFNCLINKNYPNLAFADLLSNVLESDQIYIFSVLKTLYIMLLIYLPALDTQIDTVISYWNMYEYTLQAIYLK